MNKSLTVINIENAKLKNALVKDKKLNQATRMKTANFASSKKVSFAELQK